MGTTGKNLPYTKHLPEIDRIELQQVKGVGEQIEQVGSPKMLIGAEARALTQLWRVQNFDVVQARCHFPAFAAKFYLGGDVYLFATICWQCDNIYLYQGNTVWSQGFDAQGKEGQNLLFFFKRVLTPE